MFKERDLELLEKKNISKEKALWQIQQFEKGVAPIQLAAPATPQKGITKLDDIGLYIDYYRKANVKFTKFVPASGAASRMFKDLFEFANANRGKEKAEVEVNDHIQKFFDNIKKFAFYPDLEGCLKHEGMLERLVAEKRYVLILDALLGNDGLNYGSLPKGLLKFHFYAGNIGRTPFEEHLVEGAKYAKSENGEVNLHFTVSPEHIELFKLLLKTVIEKYEDMYRVKYKVSFSVQKSSTDTLAVTPENSPFYEPDGSMLFRPGGHGALIENLNEIDSDIIFIKNIDNVVPEKRIDGTVQMKQAIAGVLLENRDHIYQLCNSLSENPTAEIIQEAKEFIENTLCISKECFNGNEDEIASLLLQILNRPLRVCGMVKNEGEPGGGPFLVKDSEECVSPQVVESSQVDLTNSEQADIFKLATHFNPVDLVCSVKDFKGNKFNLTEFIDENTCFISVKSKNGKDLKALELPGLWNGAMAKWNTIFVEVPVSTFNPVKTVNDLLRDSHQ
jgi:hypothetical protein